MSRICHRCEKRKPRSEGFDTATTSKLVWVCWRCYFAGLSATKENAKP